MKKKNATFPVTTLQTACFILSEHKMGCSALQKRKVRTNAYCPQNHHPSYTTTYELQNLELKVLQGVLILNTIQMCSSHMAPRLSYSF